MKGDARLTCQLCSVTSIVFFQRTKGRKRMTYSFEKRISLFFQAAAILAIVLTGLPVIGQAATLAGTDIPLIEGARIIKEKQFEGSGRFEFEVDITPAEAVEFYHQAMQSKGWPAGRIMSAGQACALMLMHQENTFSIKAEDKDGRTYVTLAVVLKSSIEKALDPQAAHRYPDATKPVTPHEEKTLPPNRNVTIEGTPIGKGDVIRRPELPGRKGSDTGKKDDGNLPDDPYPPSDGNDPDPEDSLSDDDSQSEDVLDAGSDLPERLSVSIHASVRWTVTDPEEYEYTGTINLRFNGNMKIFEKGSPTAGGALGTFKPVLTYKAENGTVSFNYEERRISLKRIPSRKCQDPLVVEYQGGGVMPLSVESLFKIHRYSSSASPYLQNLSADRQRFLSAFKGNTALPDYYELMMAPGGSKKRINGRKKDTGETECVYIPVDRDFPGCRIGIQVELPASGILAGSRTWSADDQGLCPPSLGISILDIAATQNKKPLKPPAGGNRNVTYSLSWCLGKQEAAPDDTTDEDEEDPCEILQRRLNAITVIMATYANASIREYVDSLNYDLGKKMAIYQNAVEKAFTDATNGQADFPDQVSNAAWVEGETVVSDTDPSQSGQGDNNQAATDMTTQANETLDGSNNRWGHPLGSAAVWDHCTGSPAKIEIYDKNGNLVTQDLYSALACWQEKYGDEAGLSRFEAALKHERTHVEQYVRKGPIESIDDMAMRELEAYQNEFDGLLKDKKKLDCN